MGLSTCDREHQTLPEAKLRKVSSAPQLSRQLPVLYSKQREPSSEGQEKELCLINGAVKEILNPQDGSARKIFKAPVEWIRSHPVLTLAVLTLLLLLAVAVAVLALPILSERRCADTPVTPVAPNTPLLLACPDGWVGYRGICYFLSRDHLAWDQAKARCSELEASLAVLEDWEMEFLFRHGGNVDYWLGLHKQDQRLQWVDGSNFSSSVPLLGNAECVFLADNRLRSGICSNDMLYICRRPQTHLCQSTEEGFSPC